MKNLKLDKKHLLIIGGVVLVVVIYMYIRNQSANSSTTSSGDTIGTVPTDTSGDGSSGDYSGSGYDSLANQQQTDEGTLSTLQGYEATDATNISALQGAESTDASNITGLTTAEGNDAGNIANLGAAEAADASAISAGQSSLASQSTRSNKIVTSINKLKKTVNADNRKIASQHNQIVKLQKGKASPTKTTHRTTAAANKGKSTSKAAVGHANPGHVSKPKPPPKKHTARR